MAKADDSDDYASEADSTTPNDKKGLVDWAKYAHRYDVVITTYSVLRSEIWVARPPLDRPQREDVMYDQSGRTRSPLVLVKWKRVIMDEVQMVGGGQAASVLNSTYNATPSADSDVQRDGFLHSATIFVRCFWDSR
jgi:E3 ubiquitin-protein ligase SHPRH